MKKNKKQMVNKNYQVLNVGNRLYVVCEAEARPYYRTGGKIPEANYMNSGMALCGIIDRGKTLGYWKKKNNK